MTNTPALAACLLASVPRRIARRVPDAHAALNGFIIHVALPALILGQIHGLRLTTNLLWPLSVPWLMFALSAAAFIVLARVLRLPCAVTGALVMATGLTATSLIGLPMIKAHGAPAGIASDQLGVGLVLSTAGAAVACLFSAGTAARRQILLRALRFPPLAALVLAVLLAPVEHPVWLAEALRRLGGAVAPLALVSAGLQLRLGLLRVRRAPLGLSFS